MPLNIFWQITATLYAFYDDELSELMPLNCRKLIIAQRTEPTQMTNEKMSKPVEDRGASPSGVDDPSI